MPIVVPLEVLAALAKLTDAEASRYALGGVRIEREDAERMVAVASDGRVMAAATWREPLTDRESEEFSALVPAALVKAIGPPPITRKKARAQGPIMVSHAEGKVRLRRHLDGETAIEAAGAEPDGRFPNWRAVLSGSPSVRAVQITVDPRRLAALLLAMADAGCESPDAGANYGVTLSVDPDAEDKMLRLACHREWGESRVDAAAALMTIARNPDETDWRPARKPFAAAGADDSPIPTAPGSARGQDGREEAQKAQEKGR